MELTDRDLLRRFIQDADEQAFEEIVRRYHGLVMSVCQRVSGRRADAEDAFQATFLVLARRPRSIRRASSLSHWLYTVAWRTSLRQVRQRRKQPMETLPTEPATTNPGPLDQIASAQKLLVLDEELNQLPSKYREVLVMTYFTEHSNQQIADQLDVSRGTVDGRLRRGRNLLRIRLARRGVELGVLAVATGLLSDGTLAVSPQLLSATTQLGVQTLANTVPGTTDLSQLEPLVRPETAMVSSKLVVTGVVCASVVAGAAGLLHSGTAVEQTPVEQMVPLNDVVPSEPRVGSPAAILVSQVGESSSVRDAAADPESDKTMRWPYPGEFAGKVAPNLLNPWPGDAQPVEKWMFETLDKPAPELNLRGETPLSEVLTNLLQESSEAHGTTDDGSFAFAMWVDRQVLSDEGVDGLDKVNISDLRVDNMTLRSALKMVFECTDDPPLTYVIEDEVMKITTVHDANSERRMTTRVYPVGHLLAADAEYWERQWTGGSSGSGGFGGGGGGFGGGGGGFFSVEDDGEEVDGATTQNTAPKPKWAKVDAMSRLITIVQTMTAPPVQWLESEGAGGSISAFGDNLVVRQSYDGHQQIVRLLNLLAESVAAGDQGSQ